MKSESRYLNRYDPPEVVRDELYGVLVKHGPILLRQVVQFSGYSKTSVRKHLDKMVYIGTATKTDAYPAVYSHVVLKGRVVHKMSDTPKKSYPGQTQSSRPRGCTILEAGL